MCPPEPIRALTFPRKAWTVMLAVSARLRAATTMFFTFGKEMSWRQPRRRGQDSGGGDETPARKAVGIVSNQLILLRHTFLFFVTRRCQFASTRGVRKTSRVCVKRPRQDDFASPFPKGRGWRRGISFRASWSDRASDLSTPHLSPLLDRGREETLAARDVKHIPGAVLSGGHPPASTARQVDRRYRSLNRLEDCLPDRPLARLSVLLRANSN